MSRRALRRAAGLSLALLPLLAAPAEPARGEEAPSGPPDAVVDLATREGTALVKGQWRYSDARVVEVDFRGPGPDRKPTGPPNRTYDVVPKAGAGDFDDSSWEAIDPTTLDGRRSTGKVCFNWYRINVTIPERIGSFETAGSDVVFEIVVDDYAEVWVDGSLPRELGQSGGSLVKGWNAPNRLIAARKVRPGRRIQLAVFGINGPISDAPGNFIWVRRARLEFHRSPRAVAAAVVPHEVLRKDPALDAIVPQGAVVEKLAEGFTFIEGPVWTPEGRLLFSDVNENTIYQYEPDGGLSVFRRPSGYDGADVAEYTQPGSNGLAVDAEGRLTLCEHGNRRITRLEKDGRLTVLADRHDGRRLNSPNDLTYRSDGTLYFTDPPFGLPKLYEDPRKELPYSGIYVVRDGKLRLEAVELKGPNGLAFSPDEKHLYVDNWDETRKVVMRYDVALDGGLTGGRVFFDMKEAPEPEALDGLKVDTRGNVYVSGPGGLWILSPEGRHLGTIRTPELAANFAWGDRDGRTLYMTARHGLYRIRLGVSGLRPFTAARVTRKDPRFDALVPPGAKLERLAGGFRWIEGPVWDRAARELLFSDIPANVVMRWKEGNSVSPYLSPSGYTGSAPFAGPEPGSNGLALDAEGRLVLAEHGDRRIARLEKDGRKTTLADRYEGRRLNSPNDLVYGPGGALYFTDPPFGLPRTFDDPGRELSFQGVYRLSKEGRLTLLTKDLPAPNGLVFSPDGGTLYVSNADAKRAVYMAYDVTPDRTLGRGRVFFDATVWARPGAGDPDGLEVDRSGNLFAAGPGGIHVFAPDGSHLGTLEFDSPASNLAWGDDGSTLYITAGTALYRIRLSTSGPGY